MGLLTMITKILMFFFWVFVGLFLTLPQWLPYAVSKLLKKREAYIEMKDHFSAARLSFIHEMKNTSALLQKYYFYLSKITLRWDRDLKK